MFLTVVHCKMKIGMHTDVALYTVMVFMLLAIRVFRIEANVFCQSKIFKEVAAEI